MTIAWLTNNPEAARKLKAADRRYERAKRLLGPMMLEQKIEAIRKLKQKRADEYARILKEV